MSHQDSLHLPSSSLSRKGTDMVSSILSSSTSLSRAKTVENDVSKLADSLLRQSLTASRNTSSYKSALQNARFPGGVHLQPRHSSSKGFDSRSKQSSTSRATSSGTLKRELRKEIDEAKGRVHRPNYTNAFKTLCSVDLLFLMDTTNSMRPYIDSVKEQVRSIVADIVRTFYGESEVRISIVSYKDHNCDPHIQFLDFTSSIDAVHLFLDELQTDWGRDFPEDVLGGINKAIGASWSQPTRCIVHIGDAPAHGRNLHDFGQSQDEYHVPGSEPHGLTYEPLIRRLLNLRIHYAFLRITGHTDRMLLSFALAYGRGNAKLLSSNKYFNEINSITAPAEASAPRFEEFELGVNYSELARLVLKTVTGSFSRTVGQLTMSWSRGDENLRQDTNKTMSSVPVDIANNLQADVVLEQLSPVWNDRAWFDKTIEVTGFSPVGLHNAETLQKMMDSDDYIDLGVTSLVLHVRSRPFAKGAMRIASYARTEASSNHYVVKSSIKAKRGRAEVAEDMRMQALCKAFALEFNGLLDVQPPLDFVVTSCLQEKGSEIENSGATLSLEPYIPGNYVKYNTNASWVNDDTTDEFNRMAQAFSHFTFERSWGHLLVNDLQGVDHLLTDPAIQTKSDERFTLSDTNFGEAGMKLFFVSHECNEFCNELGLKSNREMFLSGDFEFRETWPAMEPTVCCSNIFCRSIIRMAHSRQSTHYPEHQWCDKCWPQLDEFATKITCEEPGSFHEFETSRFFHESQGQLLPQRCPEHRPASTAESSVAAVGGKMFNKRLSRAPSIASVRGNVW